MPEPEFPKSFDESEPRRANGRLLSLDLGTKRVGVAVSDELQVSVKPLTPLGRTNWKALLRQIQDLQHSFDAQAVVIGLPLKLDGTEGDAAVESRRIARNLSLSLDVPVYLQDERLTSHAATESLRDAGVGGSELTARLDSEAAALILRDFISHRENQAEDEQLKN